MKIVITGGAGFVGRALVARLAERGDELVALVRDPQQADHLRLPNVALVASDLSDGAALKSVMNGADAVIHGAGSYRIGIRAAARPAMWEANVLTTERVLDAAIAAGVPRIVYLSTVNVFGDTKGIVADETHRRNHDDGFLSWYDETKFRAHEVAEARIAAGAPLLIVMPAQVYGPHDYSVAGQQLELAYKGRLRFQALAGTGLTWVHVDDLAVGIIAALDRGRIAESYIFGGDSLRIDESIALAARAGGHRPPGRTVPTLLLRLLAPINDRVHRLPSLPANLSETIRSGDGVTYWSSSAKAARELGFESRPLARE